MNGWIPESYYEGWVALKLLEGDSEITEKAQKWLPEEAWRKVEALLKEHEDAVLDIASGRYEWIARMVRAAVRRPQLGQVSITDRLDRFAVHPLWGLLLLLAAFGLVFWLTFTLAAPVQAWLDVKIVGGLQGWLTAILAGAPTWLVHLLSKGILVSQALLKQMLEELVRQGYLLPLTQGDSTPCERCPLPMTCLFGNRPRIFTLTTKAGQDRH